MSDTTIHISDYTALLDLRESVRLNSEQMLATVGQADDHFNGVLQEMKAKVDLLEQAVEEARRRTDEARERLARARERQYWDDEHQEYRPSTGSEEARLERAEAEQSKRERHLDEARRILSDTQGEVDKWRYPGGGLVAPGGRGLMEHLCGSHTEKTLQRLSDIIEVTEEIMGSSVTLGGRSNSREEVRRQVLEEQQPIDGRERIEHFNEAAERVRSMGRAADYRQATGILNQHMQSTKSDLCQRCGRPVIACICPRGERERGHTNFYDLLLEQQRQRQR